MIGSRRGCRSRVPFARWIVLALAFAWSGVAFCAPETLGIISRPTGNPDDGGIIILSLQDDEARVTAYDNWISFGALSPVLGSASASQAVIANGQPTTFAGPDLTTAYDFAGIQIATGSRLHLDIDMGGHLTRVGADGTPSPALDTRKPAGGYALKTEFKMNLCGIFSTDLSSGTRFWNPTSQSPTAIAGAWTGWTHGGGGGDAGVAAEAGWLSPAAFDAWTGEATLNPHPGFTMIVEADQGIVPGPPPAELWFAARVLRRGLQDVAGNYRQAITIHLYYAE